MAEAPTARDKCAPGTGCSRTTASQTAAFTDRKASCIDVVQTQTKALGEPYKALVRGRRNLVATGRVFEVKTLVRGGNEDVIKVAKHKWQPRHYTVRHPLEGGPSITQSKRHNKELVHAKRRNHCSLGYVSWVHGNLVITLHQIKLRKHVRTSQSVGEISNVGDQILVRNSCIVEAPKIAARTPQTIRLGNHMQSASPCAVRPADNTGLLHFVELQIGRRVQTVGRRENRLTNSEDMVIHTMLGLKVTKT